MVSRHLDKATAATEAACQSHHGIPLEDCSDAFVDAYIDAKIGNPEASRALYHASTGLDMKDLTDTAIARLHRAAHGLLVSAQDGQFDDLDGVVFSWVAVVTGGTRQIFEEDETIARLPIFRKQLARMCRSYLSVSSA